MAWYLIKYMKGGLNLAFRRGGRTDRHTQLGFRRKKKIMGDNVSTTVKIQEKVF